MNRQPHAVRQPGSSGHRFRAMPLLVLALAALFLLAGCGSTADDETIDASSTADESEGADGDSGNGDEPGSEDETTVDRGEPRPIDLDRLTTGTWTLRFGGGPDGDILPVDGQPITMVFDGDGSVTGSAGCNGYGGTYRIDGVQLVIGEVGSTEVACEPSVMAAESAFFSALGDVSDINLSGEQLALGGMATELIFVPNPAAPIDDVVGRAWLLEATLVDGVPTPVEGEPAVFVLNADGTFTGGTGCRQLIGDQYQVSGSSIFFNSWGAEGDCPASLRDQDGLIIGTLEGGITVEVDGDQLLAASSGNQGLQFRAVDEDEAAGLVGTSVPSDAEALDGIEWVFVGGDSPDGPIPDPASVDAEAVITLIFTGDGYRGEAVCNAYGGPADIGESLSTFTLGEAATEEEGCGSALDELAATYLAALPQMNEGGVEDDGRSLVMNGNDIELWFERAG